MALNARQRRFVDEYLIEPNATIAAEKAGYSPRSAYNQGDRMMKNDEVMAEIKRRQDERSARTGVTAYRVVNELAKIAFGHPRQLYHPDGTPKQPHEWDDDAAALVAGIEVEVRRPVVGTEEDDSEEEQEPQPQGGSLRRRRRLMTAEVHKVKRNDKMHALELLGKHLGMFTEKVEHSGQIAQTHIYLPQKQPVEPSPAPDKGAS